MKRRQFVALIAGAAVVWPWGVHAQQPTAKSPRIGFLANIRSPLTDDFERGLSELGYVQGKNIFIEWWLAQGKFERLPELATDLVRLNVDLIVAPSPAYIRAARQATSSIPIVFALAGDPVSNGFVASLARPGGNITRLTSIVDDLARKMLELLKETIPSATRIAVLCDWVTDRWRGDVESAARLLTRGGRPWRRNNCDSSPGVQQTC
jgi:putative ABC transport system substrate-binding protein